jgi:DNA-binding winged helix-turn-helix (wHTH) protein
MLQESLRVYKVFIASPSDVAGERKIAFDVVDELNSVYERQGKDYRLEVRAWENHSHPDLGLPQAVIKNQISIEECDIFIGVFWKRFGTPPGSMRPSDGRPYLSGTEEEIDTAITARKTSSNQRPVIMLYRKLDQTPNLGNDEDYVQYAKVIEFFRQCQPGGEHPALVGEFEENQFYDLLKRHLLQVMKDFEPSQPQPIPSATQHDVTSPGKEYVALDRARRVLEILEEKAAGYTHLTIPAHLQIELEEKRRQVAELEDRLAKNFTSVENSWFDRIGLRGNPFEYPTAELDAKLFSCLIQPQFLRPVERQIRGDGDVSSWIVFANKGYGKTTLCQMIAQDHYPAETKDDVLCIVYDLDALGKVVAHAGNSLEALEPLHYVKVLQELLLHSVKNAPEHYDAFSECISSSSLQKPHPQNVNARHEFKALAEIICQQGFRYLLCLLDQVDEVLVVEAQPEKMVRLLKPLMRLSLQATPGVAFRYFLPKSLETLMQEQHGVFRLDRYKVIRAEWIEEDLQRLVEQRLSAFSTHPLNPLNFLGQLCEPSGNFGEPIDQALIRLAEGSPRATVWLANRLIEFHCRAEDPPRFIQSTTWEQVQAAWWASGRNQLFGSLTQSKGFTLQGGRIYFQGYEIVLSKKYDALLRCLIRKGGGICSKAELIRAAWPDDDLEGVSNQALAEAIRRMKLELKELDCDPGWITSVRRRGYRLQEPRDTERDTADSKSEGDV